MHLNFVIFTLSLSTTLAYPLHSESREATWVHSNANQAHDKKEHAKEANGLYKSIIHSTGLYTQEHAKNPVAEEIQLKLAMESERLRLRLRQELAELRERLSPSPAHLSALLARMREHLTPLTQQLQSSLSSRTQDMCSQLNLYLQGLEMAEAQSEASLALHQEAFLWISRSLDHSSLQLAAVISDFHTSASGMIESLKRQSDPEEDILDSQLWETASSKLGQEASLLREEAQSRVEALRSKLADLLESAQSRRTEVSDSVEVFCQNSALQSQVLPARLERLLIVVEEEVRGASSSLTLPPSSLSTQEGGSLQEDFSVRLSALIQDILHSVQ